MDRAIFAAANAMVHFDRAATRMTGKRRSRMLESFGLELEYMIVDRKTLQVRPLVDQLLRPDPEQDVASDIERGDMVWRSELATHIFELRSAKPVRNLVKLKRRIKAEIKAVNKLLKQQDAMLLPTGAHPFMDPRTETQLWQHDRQQVHQLCHELFDLKTHSWSNVYSAHLEVSFHNDDEFAKLHAAARLLLPIIPALSASSPFLDGRYTGFLDSRMEAYLHAQEKHPDLMGSLVPEAIYSQEDYYREIYGPIVKVLAEHDPARILDHQHMNTRGAVPHFERNMLQLRVIDTQECPSADLAIAEFIVVVLRALTSGRWVSSYVQRAWPETDLLGIFLQVIKDGGNTMIANRDYLLMFGLLRQDQMPAMKLWQHLFVELYGELGENCRQHIGHILEHGSLAQRIMKHTGRTPDHASLLKVYGELAVCLKEDRSFV